MTINSPTMGLQPRVSRRHIGSLLRRGRLTAQGSAEDIHIGTGVSITPQLAKFTVRIPVVRNGADPSLRHINCCFLSVLAYCRSLSHIGALLQLDPDQHQACEDCPAGRSPLNYSKATKSRSGRACQATLKPPNQTVKVCSHFRSQP